MRVMQKACGMCKAREPFIQKPGPSGSWRFIGAKAKKKIYATGADGDGFRDWPGRDSRCAPSQRVSGLTIGRISSKQVRRCRPRALSQDSGRPYRAGRVQTIKRIFW